MTNMASAASVDSTSTDDEQVQRGVLQTEVRSLYTNVDMALIGAFITAVVLWALFYQHTQAIGALVWAAIVHIAQGVRLLLMRAYRRDDAAATRAVLWRRRYRLALFVMACIWGAAPLFMLQPDDVAYAALLMLVLLGITVGGTSTLAADRLSILIWLLPVLVPLPLTLLWYFSPVYLALAALTLAFVAVNLRAVLAQNDLLRTTLRAQLENAALVERLNHQIELTAQASRDKSQFLAAASHDLRQPLHALSFFGATLEQRMTGSKDLPLIANMMRAIEALDRSFSAILDLSKLDAGAIEPRMQSFAVRDVFSRLQTSFGGQAESAGLQLRFRTHNCIVASDPQLLERILGNLVQNALRYCPAGGVLVAARERIERVDLEVWDTGIGIDAAELPKIFAEFYQVANPERDRNKGLGMGLAIVKRLTVLLGHELTAHSVPGRGSVFRIGVGLGADADAQALDATAKAPLPPNENEPSSVLLIDDEAAIRTSVAELLRERGLRVSVAATIAEAVAAARATPGGIDIVLSDMRLRAGEDGLQAIAEVRRACGRDVAAVLITGDTSSEQVQRMHESGYTVLYKPVQPQELLTLLDRLARRRGAERLS